MASLSNGGLLSFFVAGAEAQTSEVLKTSEVFELKTHLQVGRGGFVKPELISYVFINVR